MPRVLAFPAVVVAVLLAASACAPQSAPTPSPTSATALDPTPVPTSTVEPETSRLVLGPDGFVIEDGHGDVSFEFAWADEPQTAIAELERLFETPPEVTIAAGGAGGPHYAPFDMYRWNGLFLGVAQLDRPRDEYFMPSFVGITSHEAHGVVLTSRVGIEVGDDIASVLALVPAPQTITFPSDEGEVVYHYADFSTDPLFSRAVLFDPDDDRSHVERLIAPRSPDDP